MNRSRFTPLIVLIITSCSVPEDEGLLASAAQACGHSEASVYFIKSKRDAVSGKLTGIDYATDGGREQDVKCINDQLAKKGVKRI